MQFENLLISPLYRVQGTVCPLTVCAASEFIDQNNTLAIVLVMFST